MSSTDSEPRIEIREAEEDDRAFVVSIMNQALKPYYGGDHTAHAERIFWAHVSGGVDLVGHFSFEQKMFIATYDGEPVGMLHLVGKRQGTYKISPIIVAPLYRGRSGLGTALIEFAEAYATARDARQIYCTVAEENTSAVEFFRRRRYIVAGSSDSHYKAGITELMMFKAILDPDFDDRFDRPHISVLPLQESHEAQVKSLLLSTLPKQFLGIDEAWVESLFDGYKRRVSRDVNLKFKVIYIAQDRTNSVLGIAAATPKKGEPIKLMPLIATTLPAFVALLSDIPYLLKPYGRKLYLHLDPTVEQVMALQQQGWRLDAALPGGYHDDHVTQQWSLDLDREDVMRTMRVKQYFLDSIKDGRKTLEVRVGYDHVKGIQAGERLRFASRSDSRVVLVRDVRRYETFVEMLDVEEASRIAPGQEHDQVLALLKDIYPADRERLGVIVLDLDASSPDEGPHPYAAS